MRLYAVHSKDFIYRRLKQINRQVQVINGGRVEIQFFFQCSNGGYYHFLILLCDVIPQAAHEQHQMTLNIAMVK